jgi:hypothetical protein
MECAIPVIFVAGKRAQSSRTRAADSAVVVGEGGRSRVREKSREALVACGRDARAAVDDGNARSFPFRARRMERAYELIAVLRAEPNQACHRARIS